MNKIKIQYNYRDLGSINFEKKLTSKEFHLICTAREGGLSIFQEAVLINRHEYISREKGSLLLKTINENNETGTLYPLFNISILPLSIYNGRNSFEDKNAMERNILDAINANEIYAKAPIIVFAIDRQIDFNGELALKTLEEIVKSKTDFIHTKEIYCTPFVQISNNNFL